jgi:D-alanine-D-alanine ligase
MKTIAVLFGGCSTEHEISVITALQAISAIDPLRYKIIPVYIDALGKWYTGEALLKRGFYRALPSALSEVRRVALLPDPAIKGLIPVDPSGIFLFDEIIPVDLYFLSFHGQYGEDGCIQGLLEMAGCAYTGCNVVSSALAMDKYLCKMFLKAHEIPVLPALLIRRDRAMQGLDGIHDEIASHPDLKNFPLFVKPNHLGSSVGVSIARDRSSLNSALARAFRYDDQVLIEPCITDLLEINISVLDGSPPLASVTEIPIASGDLLSYEDKYLSGGSKTTGRSDGMAGLSRIIDPLDLDPGIKQSVREYALKAFELIGCCGLGRFDFIFDKKTEKLYFNELNPIPGSFTFYLWDKSEPRLLYTEVIDRLVALAEARKARHLSLERTIAFKALART